MFYDIYLNGCFYDNVYFNNRMSCKKVKEELKKEGYPSGIVVKIVIE